MLGNRSRGRFKNLPLGKLRQRRILCAVLVRLCFERGAKTGVNVFPACRQDRFALGGERLAAAVKGRRNGFILLRRCNGTQQLADGTQQLNSGAQQVADGVLASANKTLKEGGLIDTDALIEALRARKFGGVGLDVYEDEDDQVFQDFSDDVLENEVVPVLLSFPNVVITSHQAFFTRTALQSIAAITLENARAFARGEELKNEVKA